MTKPQPARAKITAYLANEVLPHLAVGQELPTIREMAALHGVSGVQTVRDGVAPFVEKGYVTTRMTGQRRWVLARPYSAPQPVPGAKTLDELREALLDAQAAVAESLSFVEVLRKAA